VKSRLPCASAILNADLLDNGWGANRAERDNHLRPLTSWDINIEGWFAVIGIAGLDDYLKLANTYIPTVYPEYDGVKWVGGDA
jgi:hypothetical protein